MSEVITRTSVSIYGESYALKSDLPEEVVQALAHHVDSLMQVLASKERRGSNPTRVAVLTALNLAEELFQMQARYDDLTQAMQQQWRAKRDVKQLQHS